MAKLYQNESEKLDEEMRVFDMDRKLSSDDDGDKPAKSITEKKKRQAKAEDKTDGKNRDKSKQRGDDSVTLPKINKLVLLANFYFSIEIFTRKCRSVRSL